MVDKWMLAAAARKISSPFCCGGSLAPEFPVRICYRQQDSWQSIALPDGIQALAAACSEASFGIGGERVMDPSYRKALKLEPGDFTTNFDLSGYGILDEIKTLLFPSNQRVIPKLYKLNVYAQGDFFKAHVDTPQAGNMLASLVVSLPCAHSGGDLVVRHGKKSQSFSFGGENSDDRIGWAAFFSDCEHEVLEVTSGHRLTLTYNLFVEESSTVAGKTDFSRSELYKLFVEAKASGKNMTLGFPCEHLYAQGSEVSIPEALKGSDAFVYHAAVAAGLEARVCSVWSREKFGDNRFIGHESMLGKFVVSDDCYESQDKESFDLSEFLDRRLVEEWKIVWCRGSFDWNLGGACASYGNEPSTESFYCAAAILVTIRGGSQEESDESEEKESDEEEEDEDREEDESEEE
ncbi:uncharacterized protein LOC9641358 [Selaginella moellendorffii]|nr:uncharacterized protein LOC9641358 [Selaginella moellendorffii]|eukprot:XP_024534140.1 uncharacterized protein LOC9641358 [Selaginella moellendorffii]